MILSDLVQRQQAAFVLGTGVTVASTGDRKLSWSGLIRRGLAAVHEETPKKPDKWFEIIESELDYGEEAGDSDLLISAATKITQALGGRKAPAFKAWLRQEFEALSPHHPQVIDAIGASGLPILTTNYDHLVETRLQRGTVTWQESSEMQQVLSGRSQNVGHLHGSWAKSDSVIFGSDSYGELLGHESAQSLQQAVATTRSLIFVGCGTGLEDPNFSSLLSWTRQTIPGSELFHYLLCRDNEAENAPASENLRIVTYGAEHEDLAPFLRSLAPEPVQVTAKHELKHGDVLEVADRAAELVLEQLRYETVISDHLDDPDRAKLAEMTVPPPLLPVTQQQYVDSQDLPDEQRITRCKLEEELAPGRRLIISADDRSGLSTSLKWLIYRFYQNDKSVIPISIDFRALQTGKEPLKKRIIRELSAAGHMQRLEDPLPPIALAIDNVSNRPEKIFGRMLEELSVDSIRFLVIGTRTGNEVSIQGALAATDSPAIVRYLGRMNSKDILGLANLVNQTRADDLAKKTIQIINQEHLPRTPFTIGLLLTAIMHGKSFMATASETALLDAYITLLLGGGDPHDDARFTLDAYERGQIMAVLAATFLRRDSGSLPVEEVTQGLREYFDTVDWSEDPLDVLTNLRSRHLIKNVEGHVSFTQASYLHLFAAKAAIRDQELREKVFGRPLYYASIIRHYAALNREDDWALRKVAELLALPEEAQTNTSNDGFFSERDVDSVLGSRTIDELLDNLNLSESSLKQAAPRDLHESEMEFDLLDHMDDSDLEPFPVDRVEDSSPVSQALTALTLVSSVLRDSEMVTDLDLKTAVLARTLSVWGKLVMLLEVDEDFTEFISTVAERVADEVGIPPNKRQMFIDGLVRSSPALVGLGGMNSTLATRKLIKTLNRVFAEPELLADAPASVMGAFLSFGIDNGAQWTTHFRLVQDEHPTLNAVNTIMVSLAIQSYYFNSLPPLGVNNVEDFIAKHSLGQVDASDRQTELRIANQVKQRMRLNRARYSKARLDDGESVLSDPQPYLELEAGS